MLDVRSNAMDKSHFINFSSNPSIFVFQDAILQIQTVNYSKIRLISDVAPQSRTEKEKLDFLFDLWRKYQSGHITRGKYQARTDM